VKPAPFDYRVAANLGHAVELLDGTAAGGKVLAGGQSLVPLMNLRTITPGIIVDISRCSESSGIRDEGDRLAIGALTTYRSLEDSALVGKACGLLGAALRHVGSPGVRNRGTIGGSLAHADPASEWCAVAAALDAEMIAKSSRGTRTMAATSSVVSG